MVSMHGAGRRSQVFIGDGGPAIGSLLMLSESTHGTVPGADGRDATGHAGQIFREAHILEE